MRSEVRFIVVGGVSAVLQGVPYTTFDLDVVHSRDAENVSRLLRALESLDAYCRIHLDVHGLIGDGHEYEELKEHSIQMDIAEGMLVNVLDLETLIRVKEETAGDKDLAVLPLLRRTLEENRDEKRGSGPRQWGALVTTVRRLHGTDRKPQATICANLRPSGCIPFFPCADSQLPWVLPP